MAPVAPLRAVFLLHAGRAVRIYCYGTAVILFVRRRNGMRNMRDTIRLAPLAAAAALALGVVVSGVNVAIAQTQPSSERGTVRRTDQPPADRAPDRAPDAADRN